MATALAKLASSRRMSSRFETMEDIWVYWSCQGMEDVSRVCDLSLGGLCLSTHAPPPIGAKVEIGFLVREGQIRAEAVVRHFVSGRGLGLKFTAITNKDCPQLAALLNRIRTLSSARRYFPGSAIPVARHKLLAAAKMKDVHDSTGPAI